MTKKFRLSAIFTFVAILILSIMASASLLVSPARATENSTSGVFQMEYGASIQLSKNGLRFKAKMSEDYYEKITSSDDVTLYGFIARVEEFDRVTAYSDFITGGKRVGGALDKEKIYLGEDGYYYANVVMTNLADGDRGYQDDSFSAIVFIEDKTSGSAKYTYAEFAKDESGHVNIEAQNRLQYDVVNSAFLDGKESYESRIISAYGSWYGTAEYPIVINTEEQYKSLVTKLSANEDFAKSVENKHVFIKLDVANAVSSYGEGQKIEEYVTTVTETQGHTVTFWDGNKIVARQFVADDEFAAKPDYSKENYELAGWFSPERWDFVYHKVTKDLDLYARWKPAKGEKIEIGNNTLYGVTRADGSDIESAEDVIGQKVVLASGYLADGAYYPGETSGVMDPTDENKTADQAFLAFDGEYSFNDYFVADFTGKNMPTLAFFANNYNASIFYGDGKKDGVAVVTGLTWPNGLLFTEGAGEDGGGPYSTSVWDGHGIGVWGANMIYSMGGTVDGKGALLTQAIKESALGRANLELDKRYRIIMGFQEGDSGSSIKLVYCLYDLDSNKVVEFFSQETYGFFTGSNATVDNKDLSSLKGSIVAYGYFGTTTVLDKVYDIYTDTSINDIASSLDMNIDLSANNTSVSQSNDQITLAEGTIGGTANYETGDQTENGYVHQSYVAIDGDYGVNDYVAFDFTGKNIPEIAFFAKNYDDSMYYAEGKQGIVVTTGIVKWDGKYVLSEGKEIHMDSPYMVRNSTTAWFTNGSVTDSKLARANLVDGTKYRVVMGFTSEGSALVLNWKLLNRETGEEIETKSLATYGFFDGGSHNASDDSSINDVSGLTIENFVGSIVLYGKFSNKVIIDKLYGVYEDTNIGKVLDAINGTEYTVTFVDSDGEVLQESTHLYGEMPSYSGTPYKYGDGVNSSYVFAGWDKEITPVTGDVTYTAVYNSTIREDLTLSGGKDHTYGVIQNGDQVVLKASNLGDNANYTVGQQNADGAWVHQSYLALDGNYKLNDYVAFDFTGKNMPEIAFFANNYDNSMYAGNNANGNQKTGIVVVTGITKWCGCLTACTHDEYDVGVNGNGTQINYGFPYMIQDATNSGFVGGAFANSALGRANLVDGRHYRVIMGFTETLQSDYKPEWKITLKWYLYNLDTNTVEEEGSMTTHHFFSGSNPDVGNMTRDQLSGSIVLYGKFGVACTLDKIHGVFKDTDIATVAAGINNEYTVTYKDEDGSVLQEQTHVYGEMPKYLGETPVKYSSNDIEYNFIGWDKELSIVTANVIYTAQYEVVDSGLITPYKLSVSGDKIILGEGQIGDNAHPSGSNNLDTQVIGTVDQSYLALDGNYGLGDYVVFDFTGKNMPTVAFFANNYNNSMYYENGDKNGIVVLTGLTNDTGTLYTEFNDSKSVYDGKGLLLCGPKMLHNTMQSGLNGVLGFGSTSKGNTDLSIGRANLVDGRQYRVFMGMESCGTSAVRIVYLLYNLTDNVEVERFSGETYNYFTGDFAGNGQTRDQYCQGSIVLYGHFGTTTTIDKLWGVDRHTNLAQIEEKWFAKEEAVPESGKPDYSGYDDQFDFYAYNSYSDGTYEIDGETYYVGKNLANFKQYSLYGEVGMTIYFPQNDMEISDDTSSIEKAKKLIDDLAKVGITKTILQDRRIVSLSMTETAIVGSGCRFTTESDLDNYIYNCVKDYADYPGVYGVMLGDEPKYACLSAYSAVYKSIKRVNVANGWNLFIQYNLNPLNVSQEVYENYYPSAGTGGWSSWSDSNNFKNSVTRYTKYINDFLDAMQPDSITYDDYPFMIKQEKPFFSSWKTEKFIKDSYIPCLQIVAKAAADRGIKFYHVTQAYANQIKEEEAMTIRRELSEADSKWLNNILIGFGAKQIAYYTYYTRAESDSTGTESYVDGKSFVDYNGNPTSFYYWMQKIMANNQKFAPTVMQFDYKGSRLYGSTSATHLSEITMSDTFTTLSAFSVSTGSAIVTELYDDENKNYMYMAMNVLDPDTSSTSLTATMTFSGYTNVLVYRDGEFSEVALSNSVYTADLTPGEAVYVIPYN